jgi:hypothetical protein
MANEVMDGNLEVSGDVGERMVQEALKSLHPETTDQSKVETPKEEIKTEEVKETTPTEVKPEPETTEGKEPEKTSEVKKSETVTSENKKPMYTPEEVSRLLADETAKADTSRMTPETQIYYREMQRGLTQKSQRLSDERRQLLDDITKREKALRDKEIAEEEKKLRAEEELLDPDHARDRQEKRQIMREKDSQADELRKIKERLDAEEKRRMLEYNDREWHSAMTTHNIPNDTDLEPVLQDLTFAYTWAKNVGLSQQGQSPIQVSEGAKVIADLIGNEANLRKFINANPKFKEALEKEIVAEHLKKQSAGPNVMKSSPAAAKEKPESDGKPTKEMIDNPDFDWEKKTNEDALALLRKTKT